LSWACVVIVVGVVQGVGFSVGVVLDAVVTVAKVVDVEADTFYHAVADCGGDTGAVDGVLKTTPKIDVADDTIVLDAGNAFDDADAHNHDGGVVEGIGVLVYDDGI
jgi:hypothetical protein